MYVRHKRCILVRRCRLPLMPCHLPRIRNEESENHYLYRLLKGAHIATGRFRRRYTPSHTFELRHRRVSPPLTASSYPSHRTDATLSQSLSLHVVLSTSSVHSRSLPVPRTLRLLYRPRPRSRSFTHLRSVSSFPESQHDYNSPVRLPPNYSAGA